MQGLDWMSSAALALVLLITGVIKAFRYEQARKSFPWVKDVPRALVQVIGIDDVLRGWADPARGYGVPWVACARGRCGTRIGHAVGCRVSPPAA